jgi:hypothetical protein
MHVGNLSDEQPGDGQFVQSLAVKAVKAKEARSTGTGAAALVFGCMCGPTVEISRRLIISTEGLFDTTWFPIERSPRLSQRLLHNPDSSVWWVARGKVATAGTHDVKVSAKAPNTRSILQITI